MNFDLDLLTHSLNENNNFHRVNRKAISNKNHQARGSEKNMCDVETFDI